MKTDKISNHNILELQDLSVVYSSEDFDLPVLRDIDLEIKKSQIYGLVGESGSGKTTLGLTILRYLPPEGRVTRGMVKLDSRDLLKLSKSEMRALWGRTISLVPQDPFSSLNPSLRVGEQVAESIRTTQERRYKTRWNRAVEWLERVRIPDSKQAAYKYPHELSGGQKQRIHLAIALSNHPELLVLDEPTTSLDVTTEALVLDLLRDLIIDEGVSALYITHNLGIVAGLTDRVAVLYAGELVEDAPTGVIFHEPLHPYTQGLLMSVPRLGMHKDDIALQGIQGQMPAMNELPNGCIYSPRCIYAVETCHRDRPPLVSLEYNRRVRCHLWRDIQEDKIVLSDRKRPFLPEPPQEPEPTLNIQNLDVIYQTRDSGLKSIFHKKKDFKAVNGVSFQVGKSRTLGIVGESGSGKTSTAFAIMGLVDTARGDISLLGMNLPLDLRKRNKNTLKDLQMMFQGLGEAFSPYLTVEKILSRPLHNLLGMDKQAIQDRITSLLKMVHLPVEFLDRFPQQLSGGEIQRVAIAQAFAANPRLLIADEPVSALDVSVQANILNLLKDLQDEDETAILLISHDIAVVTYLADEVAVLYQGQVMQFSDTKQLLSPPYHPYTEALLSAVPVADPDYNMKAIHLEGDAASSGGVDLGCPFQPRCSRVLGDICREELPPRQVTPEGTQIFCHIPVDELFNVQPNLFIQDFGEGG